MSAKVISLMVLVLLLTGCGKKGVQEKPLGTAVPVITASFASQKISPGDTWKVYLKAFDPDGDMKYLSVSIEQPGVGGYSPGPIKIADRNGRELNGFLYLNTNYPGGSGFLNSVILTLTVIIRDKVGYASKPAVFPLTFTLDSQEPPPPGAFQEQELGPIMVKLQGISPQRAD